MNTKIQRNFQICNSTPLTKQMHTKESVLRVHSAFFVFWYSCTGINPGNIAGKVFLSNLFSLHFVLEF